MLIDLQAFACGGPENADIWTISSVIYHIYKYETAKWICAGIVSVLLKL